MEKTLKIDINVKAAEGFLGKTNQSKLWLIEWEVGGKKYANQYFAFKPKVDFNKYIKWLPTLKNLIKCDE